MSILKGLKVLFLARKCVFYRPELNIMQGGIFKVLKCKNEIYQWVELKE